MYKRESCCLSNELPVVSWPKLIVYIIGCNLGRVIAVLRGRLCMLLQAFTVCKVERFVLTIIIGRLLLLLSIGSKRWDEISSARSVKKWWFLPRCMECRRGLAMRILSVRLSVRLSVCPFVCLSVTRVNCDKTVERSVEIYIPYER